MNSTTQSSNENVSILRNVGMAEGLSYLLLLGVAMPIKYVLGEPLPVRILGALHGLLFMWYVLLGVQVGRTLKWRPKMFLLLLCASILPCGPFFFDRRLKDAA